MPERSSTEERWVPNNRRRTIGAERVDSERLSIKPTDIDRVHSEQLSTKQMDTERLDIEQMGNGWLCTDRLATERFDTERLDTGEHTKPFVNGYRTIGYQTIV